MKKPYKKLPKKEIFKSNNALRRMVSFRLRDQTIAALEEITEEFNRTSRVAFNKTAILEMLIMNELSVMKKRIDNLGYAENKDSNG